MTTQQIPYQVIRHGIEHPDYFQGCGVSFTNFTHVATGIGSNELEAFEDALEIIAQQGDSYSKLATCIDVDYRDSIELQEREPFGEVDIDETESFASELVYHISIRYNLPENFHG